MIPKVRFKEFSGEWVKVQLGDIAAFSKGHGYSKNDIINTGTPIILYGSLYTKYQFAINGVNTFAKLAPGSVLSEGNEVVIPASGETPEDIARASAVLKPNVIIGGDLNVLSFDLTKFSTPFIALIITNGAAHYTLSKSAQGKTVVHLNNGEIRKASIFLPSLPEQTTIATFFTHLDTLISSTSRRLEKLRAVKTAALQTLFPQEGEKEPRVRFKGFSGEWKEVKLGECLEICNERNSDCNYGHNQVLSVSEEAGVVNQIDLLGRSYAGKSVANYKILRPGQIVYTKSPLKAKPYGIVKVNKEETGIVSVLYAVYNAKENISADYIHYYFAPAFRLNNYLSPLVEKGAKNTMNISDSTALDGLVFIPPTLPEQTAIANYFTHLDTLIASTSRRLDKLRAVKSACLEGMFV